MSRPYYVIDAFTARKFAGNPAAVVLEADGLSDDDMQAVAAEFNLSETTFVLSPDQRPSEPNPTPLHSRDALPAHVRFRWFTPTTEVKMCGHATIAGVHALAESHRLLAPCDQPRDCETLSFAVSIETRSGTLRASVEPRPVEPADPGPGGRDTRWLIWLDMIAPTFLPLALRPLELGGLLGLPSDAFEPALPSVMTQDADGLVFVRDLASLNAAVPRFKELGDFLEQSGLRGLCLATVKTLTPSITVQSRFFAPTVGVNEDPVTGSVHGPLAAYLVQHGRCPIHDGVAALMCVQGTANGRSGVVYALVKPEGDARSAVRIGGHAITTMQGNLRI